MTKEQAMGLAKAHEYLIGNPIGKLRTKALITSIQTVKISQIEWDVCLIAFDDIRFMRGLVDYLEENDPVQLEKVQSLLNQTQ
jgi:hypothetical protein